MLVDAEKLEAQLNGDFDETVRSIYLTLANAKLPDSMTVRPDAHGYISRELRFEINSRWYYSAVLNQSWVLWYFRRPALSDLAIEPEELVQIFATAELTGKREVKLRIKDFVTVHAILGWMHQRNV